MIGRCFPDSQHGVPSGHPANVGCSFFRYTSDDLSNHTNQRHQHRKWHKEANKLALHCYFWSNSTQRGNWKRRTEIWEECTRFQTKSQRLADQVKTIIKKGWFSDLEIFEIHQKINRESKQQDSNTITDTPNTEKQEHSNRNEPRSNNNQNTTHPNYINTIRKNEYR